VTLVTYSRIHTPIIMALHVTIEGVKNIQCNYRVSLLFFLSISPFPQPSPFIYSSPYSYVTCKGPCSLSSSVGFIADWFSQNLPCNTPQLFLGIYVSPRQQHKIFLTRFSGCSLFFFSFLFFFFHFKGEKTINKQNS